MSLARPTSPYSKSSFLFHNSSGLLSAGKEKEPGSARGSARGSPRTESVALASLPPSRTPTPFQLPPPIRDRNGVDSAPSVESLALAGPSAYENESDIIAPAPPFAQSFSPNRNSSASTLSLQDVVGDRSDLKLQKVEAFFTDSSGEYYARYEKCLDTLTIENSQSDMCIAAYLKKAEKEWFSRYRDAKLGIHRAHSTTTISTTPDNHSDSVMEASSGERQLHVREKVDDEFLLGDEYKPPTGLRK